MPDRRASYPHRSCRHPGPALADWRRFVGQERNAEVLAWAADFNDGYSWEAGWPTEAAARIHERQAHRLLQAVERELAPEDLVSIHYWETNLRKGL